MSLETKIHENLELRYRSHAYKPRCDNKLPDPNPVDSNVVVLSSLRFSLVSRRKMEAVMIYIFCIIWIALNLHVSCGKPKKVPKTPQSSGKRESERSKKKEKSQKKQKTPLVEKSEGEKEEESDSQQKPKESKKEVPKEQPKEVKMEDSKPIVVSPSPEKGAKKEEAPKIEEKSGKKDKGDNTVREIAQKDLAKEVVEKHKPTIVTISKENADPDDGNYEDVNLMEAVAPDGTQLQLITVDPLHASFPANGGRSFHTILNVGEKRIIFKMKSSNNNDYRITPVYGFVDPIGSTVIQVLRLPGGPVRDDKMVVNYTAAPDGATDPAAAFKGLPPTTVIQTIPVIFRVTSDGNLPPGAALVPGVNPAALVPAAPTPAT
ncbi:unnamed protein product [Cylicocyclus nassatus]|uniref:Major sperm protein n=1 Tax=Cylicocyclus nassatus TaxID=53992 RepID=A0AA36DQV2_CYLNA|nr:unnamed protein product [Cylicocyclus nassatus]